MPECNAQPLELCRNQVAQSDVVGPKRADGTLTGHVAGPTRKVCKRAAQLCKRALRVHARDARADKDSKAAPARLVGTPTLTKC